MGALGTTKGHLDCLVYLHEQNFAESKINVFGMNTYIYGARSFGLPCFIFVNMDIIIQNV
ncbi:MAG: hypothetical protein KAS12_07205 [Candidatus Aenigmarchaeota archaeon]|nr:hypothetical protein [Candidatus Aenigmarchaeota archaeon]